LIFLQEILIIGTASRVGFPPFFALLPKDYYMDEYAQKQYTIDRGLFFQTYTLDSSMTRDNLLEQCLHKLVMALNKARGVNQEILNELKSTIPTFADSHANLDMLKRAKSGVKCRFRAAPHGVTVAPFLDDFCVAAPTKRALLQIREEILIPVMTDMGGIRALGKGVWELAQKFDFLGLSIDTVEGKIFIPEVKLKLCVANHSSILTKTRIPVREPAVMGAFAPALIFLRSTFAVVSSVTEGSRGWNSVVERTEEARSDLTWLKDHLCKCNGVCMAPSIDFDFSDRCSVYSRLGSDIKDPNGPQNTSCTRNVVDLRPGTGYLHPRDESNSEWNSFVWRPTWRPTYSNSYGQHDLPTYSPQWFTYSRTQTTYQRNPTPDNVIGRNNRGRGCGFRRN
jgi:hypothetical protein